ncbi:MAG: ribonuclease III domain-containing protein [Eubacteriales bacterium]|nr:ribonuclease III domain-containing protein [Eubacteriales bacterium]
MGASIDFLQYLDDKMELGDVDLREYSPLVLAYIGDDVYDLIIRTMLVKKSNIQVQKLHRKASAIVKAPAQAELIKKIYPLLTEEEEHVYKRGRNAKSYTKAKNASTVDYRKATGLEALIGYLYLKKDVKRIIDLIHAGLYGDGQKSAEDNK